MSDDTRKTLASPRGTRPPSTVHSRRTSRRVRLVVLGVVLAAITGLGIAHQQGVPVTGVDALCPFGGLESLWSLITAGTLVQRIAVSSVILLIGVIAVAVVFRRAFCGYVCPLGALQEFFGMLGRRLFGKQRPHVPVAIDRVARYLKYVVLVGFTVWTWQAATLVLRPYDPWVAYMHLTSAELFAEFAVGVAVLAVSLVGSLVYERFFCKYACPMGAFLGIISPVSIFKVRRDESVCTSCGSCDASCPVNVKVSTVATVNDPECINCNECVNACPTKGALSVSAPGPAASRRSLKPNAVLLGTGAILGLLILATTASGSFAWTVPNAQKALRGGVSGTSTQTINAEEIRGSMTFAEVSKTTGIPASAFEKRFGITDAEMDMPMKDLAEAHGFDVHTDVREWVEGQLGAQPAK